MRALLSVSDKRGIVELAQGLVEMDWEVVSTGGTATKLRGAGVPVTGIFEVTNFPECLDGRLKTLHPGVLGGILGRDTEADRAKLLELEIGYVDLVAVNLYPFEQTVAREGVTWEQAIEKIDVGGPTMIRAAAKNHERMPVVVDPGRYAEVLKALREDGEVSLELRRTLAHEVFKMTAAYDAAIAEFMGSAR